MLTATILAIFYIPLFFVLVRRSVRDGLARLRTRMERRREVRA
jgi:multidrug efflux pump